MNDSLDPEFYSVACLCPCPKHRRIVKFIINSFGSNLSEKKHIWVMGRSTVWWGYAVLAGVWRGENIIAT